ncbi:MAG: hypothetical protein QM723_20095 [Myxococcaceae bacterium]
MADQFPVYVVTKGQRVQVGLATKDGDGFVLEMGELRIGSSPVSSGSSYSSGASSGGGGGGGGGEIFPPYGRSKGMPIRGASMGDLEFYANGSRRSLNDPAKSRFHDKEKVLLAAIEAEIARQKGGGGGDNEPPPPGDEDAPF